MNNRFQPRNFFRRVMLATAGSLVLGGMALTPSYAVTDVSSIARTQLGIEIPAGWTLGTTPYLGTVSYTVRTSIDSTQPGSARRLEGAINLADFVINEASAMAAELTVNFVRDGAVIGQCTFDTAISLGGPTPNLANYQLRVVQHDTGEIQSQIGVCRVTDNGTDFASGIPDIRDTDTVQLVSNNLTLQSTLSAN